MLTSSGKPRFALHLSINEISNIPHVGGSCCVDINIRNNLKTNILSHSHSGKDHVSSGNVHAVTSKKKLHSYKCVMNFSLSCNLKFPINKKKNLIDNKYLQMKILYYDELDSSSKISSSKAEELGVVEINLSEYLNFHEATTSKYLLKDSKVNAIVSVTIKLVELSNDTDFNTLLQISETASLSAAKTLKGRATTGSLTQTKFNIPNFEKTKVFSGINDVISPSRSSSEARLSSPMESAHSGGADSNNSHGHNGHMNLPHLLSQPFKGLNEKLNGGENSVQYTTSQSDNSKSTVVAMEPMVMNLYKRILEASWDPELYKLLDYSPQVCIDNLLSGGDSWKKVLQRNLTNLEDEEEHNIRDLNGLINELAYREDLRSWTIEPKDPLETKKTTPVVEESKS